MSDIDVFSENIFRNDFRTLIPNGLLTPNSGPSEGFDFVDYHYYFYCYFYFNLLVRLVLLVTSY